MNCIAYLTSEWCRHNGRPGVITPLGRWHKGFFPLTLRDFEKEA